MGCTQSKLDQDEVISRCKDRKHLLSAAVAGRNAFAAAHSAYAVSLKNTGAALSDYAIAELPLSASVGAGSDHHHTSAAVAPPAPPPAVVENLPPPPPPLPVEIAPPLQRSVSMPDIPITPKKKPVEVAITEEEEEDEDDDDGDDEHDEHDDFDDEDDEDDEDEEDEEEHHSLSKPSRHQPQPLRRSEPIPSTITITASPPHHPPAPPSKPSNPNPLQHSVSNPNSNPNPNPPMPPVSGAWDYFFGAADSMPPATLEEPAPSYLRDPPKEEKFEKKVERVERVEKAERVERSEKFEKVNSPPPPKFEKPATPRPPPPQEKEVPVYEAQKVTKKVKSSSETQNNSNNNYSNNNNNNYSNISNNYGSNNNNVSMEGSSNSFKKRGIVSVTGPTVSSMTLLKVISQLDDHFLRAYESAADVTKMLEAAKLHYHSNFAGSKGHIDHSAKIMRVITWNRSFKRLPQHEDDLEDKNKPEEETHATILDKMLAWEKKLYEEVKAGEVMKVEYQRKVALLNKQKKRGVRAEALEKTKAAVSHLHTRYIVDMQSMDSTVAEINHLRDDLLYPKLVLLVSGMARMWRTMHDHHRAQFKLITDLRAPFEIPLPPHQTTPEHYKQTLQLHGIVKELHSELQKLLDNQKEYVKNLHGWLKLNLIPIEGGMREKVSSPPRAANPPIKWLLHAWNDYVTKLPLELARNAILSFAEVVKTIHLLQEDELTAKRRCEDTNRELERKKRQFEDWSRKLLERRSADSSAPEINPNQDPIVERRIQIEQLELKLREEQENHRRLCKQVRERSVGSLRTHLPELFRALLEFSLASSEMYRNLESVAKSSGGGGGGGGGGVLD